VSCWSSILMLSVLRLIHIFVVCSFIVFSQAVVDTTCSDEATLEGQAVLARFSSCSGVSSSQVIYNMKDLEEKNNHLLNELNTMITKCFKMADGSRSDCIATYMGSLAENDIFQFDGTQDLVVIYECLSQTLSEIPACDLFKKFFLFQLIFPQSVDFSYEVSSVCAGIASFTDRCLLLVNAKTYGTIDTCETVLTDFSTCQENSELFWSSGLMASEKYCRLDGDQMDKLNAYSEACAHTSSSRSSAKATTVSFHDYAVGHIRGFVLVLAAALSFVCTRGYYLEYRTRQDERAKYFDPESDRFGTDKEKGFPYMKVERNEVSC